jgi:hypothetical protein
LQLVVQICTSVKAQYFRRRSQGDGPAYDHAAYVEQRTGNREHDDQARRLKVSALH